MSCALVDLFKTVITNAFRKVLHGRNVKLRGLELNGKIRDQRDDLIRRNREIKNSSENQFVGLQQHFNRFKDKLKNLSLYFVDQTDREES